jgi:hypothetical protein
MYREILSLSASPIPLTRLKPQIPGEACEVQTRYSYEFGVLVALSWYRRAPRPPK